MCIYICMYVCMYVYVYIYIYIYGWLAICEWCMIPMPTIPSTHSTNPSLWIIEALPARQNPQAFIANIQGENLTIEPIIIIDSLCIYIYTYIYSLNVIIISHIEQLKSTHVLMSCSEQNVRSRVFLWIGDPSNNGIPEVILVAQDPFLKWFFGCHTPNPTCSMWISINIYSTYHISYDPHAPKYTKYIIHGADGNGWVILSNRNGLDIFIWGFNENNSRFWPRPTSESYDPPIPLVGYTA